VEIILETNYFSFLPANSQLVTEDYSSYESVSEGEEGQSAAEPTATSKSNTKSNASYQETQIG
jgi:hypothetical protein